MAKQVRKAILPAAGFGTRFLPQTKSFPKEMLPIVDKPVIQKVIEELVDAGIKDVIIVTGYHKRAIEDHFDAPNLDLIEILRQGGEKKQHLIDEIYQIANLANFVYVRQKGPYGNGTPMLNASHLIGADEPFIYSWCDDFIDAEPQEFQQLINAYQKYDCPCLACIKATSDEDYNRYGFAGGKELEEGIIDIETLIEKPGKENSPSNLATVSGFLFTGEIFKYLEKVYKDLPDGKELYWNDALKLMLEDGKRVVAVEIKNSKYYDTGNKLGYLKTVVDFALKHKSVGNEFREYLKKLDLS